MINRVILAGVLVTDLKKGDGDRPYAYGKIRGARYGIYYSVLSYKVWGKSSEYALKKGFKAGMVVQAIGNLGTGENGGTNLNIDSMTEMDKLTKVYKECPWDNDGKPQAS